MHIKTFCGGFDNNFSYLIWDKTNNAALIDASNNSNTILEFAAENGLKIKYVFIMHSHYDHLEGIKEYRKVNIPLAGHESCKMMLDKKLEDNEEVKVGDMFLKIIHTPGHLFDSICILVNNKLFTSDTLFIGCLGRVDLDGADPDALYDSVYNKILKLEDSVEIYPGHDYDIKKTSTIAHERTNNRFLKCKNKEEFLKLVS